MLEFRKGFFFEEKKEKKNPRIKTVEEIKRENPSLHSPFQEKNSKIEVDCQNQNRFRSSTSFEKMNGFRKIKK